MELTKEQKYKHQWRQINKRRCQDYQNTYRQNYPYEDVDNFLKTSLKTIDIKINRGTIKRKLILPKHICTVDFQYLKNLYNEQNGKCAITKMNMTHDKSLYAISVDRINSEVGYIPDNVQLVCRWINLAKNTHTNEEIKDVLNRFLQQELPEEVSMSSKHNSEELTLR